MQGAFNLEYLPLKVGDVQGRLEFNCNDLGLYIYDLNLKASKAGPERALYFRTCLGTSSTQSARFLNFAKQKTDYTCKVSAVILHANVLIFSQCKISGYYRAPQCLWLLRIRSQHFVTLLASTATNGSLFCHEFKPFTLSDCDCDVAKIGCMVLYGTFHTERLRLRHH